MESDSGLNSAASSQRPRGCRRFSLRSLLLVVTIVGILCAWFSMLLLRAHRQRECVAAIFRLDGTFGYDETLHDPPFPSWLWRRLGVDSYSDVIEVDFGIRYRHGIVTPPVTDAMLKCVSRLSQLQSLDLSGTQVTDAGLAQLGSLSKLRILNLSNTNVTDVGLTHLVGLSSLRVLDLRGTSVSPEGVRRLRSELKDCEVEVSGTAGDNP